MTSNTPRPNHKILNIQALRGIAVLLVVGLHLLENEKKYAHGFAILPMFFNIGTAGVDLFFVISGFVMVAITRGWFQQQGAVRRFLYHRITRIYPMYWFYSLLMLAIFLVQRKTGNDARSVDFMASFLLLPQQNLPLLVVGWTLVHEMYFYLVFSVLLLLSERWLLPLLIAWGLTTLAGLLIATDDPVIQLITNPLTLEFIAGSLVALAYFSANPFGANVKISAQLFLLTGVVWWIVAYSLCIKLGLPPESSNWVRVLVYGLPAALILYALTTMERQAAWTMPSWLVTLGDASFSIYLGHLLVIGAIGRIWEKTGVVGTGINAIVLIAMLAAIVAVGLASFRWIERSLLSFSRRFE